MDPAGLHAVDPPPTADRDESTRRKRLVADRRSLGTCCRRHCDEECAARMPPERRALERARESARARPSDRAPDSARTKSPAPTELGQSRGSHATRPTEFRTNAAALRLSPDLRAAAPRGLAAQSADAHSTGCTASRCAQPSARQSEVAHRTEKTRWLVARRYLPPSPDGPLVGEPGRDAQNPPARRSRGPAGSAPSVGGSWWCSVGSPSHYEALADLSIPQAATSELLAAAGHTSGHVAASRVSRAFFASTPPTYWPIEPSLRTTR